MKISFANSKAQKQFGINAFSNILVYGVNLIIGLWFTPFLINNLGIASYGLVPLASSVTSYMSIITLALNGAVGRFLTIDLQHNDNEAANRTFNTSFFGSIFLTIIFLPILVGLVFFVPYVFNIPIGDELAAQLLFFFVMFSFFVTTIESSFSVSSWAKNRFDLRNIVVVVSQLVRVFSVVLLFKIFAPTVWQVGIGIVLAGLVGLVGDWIIWKKLTPDFRIDFHHFDRMRVREFFGMGGWMTINQIGTLFFLNIDLIVANIVLGAKTAGEYGSILLFSTLLRSIAGAVSGVLSPTIVAKFARDDLRGITRLSSQSVRLMGIAVGLLVGLIAGFGKPFLELWLGKEYSGLWILLVLLICHLPINLAVLPLFGIQQALNKVKIPGIVTLLMGVANLLFALLFTIVLKWGAYGIAAAGAIILTLKNAFFTPIYGAYIQKIPWYSYVKEIIPGLTLSLIIGLISWISTFFVDFSNWEGLIAVGLVVSVLGIILIYFIFLKREDKTFILGFFPALDRNHG